MFSIKPGRGPSAMGAIMGIIGVIFGIFWTVGASLATREAPFPIVRVFFPLFGILFIVISIIGVIYNLQNTTGRNRFSAYDITTPAEESDPLREVLDQRQGTPADAASTELRLRQLEGLKSKGLVSETEYAAQRQRILNEI